jgi:hypothetical protein
MTKQAASKATKASALSAEYIAVDVTQMGTGFQKERPF